MPTCLMAANIFGIYDYQSPKRIGGIFTHDFTPLQTSLQLASGVEVLERLGHTLGHGLLALAHPHSWVVVPSKVLARFSKGIGRDCETYFLLGLSAPSGLPTWVLT